MDVFLAENYFLIAIAIIWMFIAAVQDFRKREVANWWSFSLIVLALAYRGFLSVSMNNAWYFLWGIIGLVVGFVLANSLYYARMFAGGDAKLMYGVFCVLPLSLLWKENLVILGWFVLLFLVAGSVYGMIYSIILFVMHFKRFKKEFNKMFKQYKVLILSLVLVGIIIMFFSMQEGAWPIAALSVLLILSPLMLIFAKAIEGCCMIKRIDVKDLTIGDWLAEDVKVGRKVIKEYWEGISEEELMLIRKHKKKVLVKYGIPFTPTFLFAFIAMMIIFKYNLNNLISLI